LPLLLLTFAAVELSACGTGGGNLITRRLI
jgi:hypothetical protein